MKESDLQTSADARGVLSVMMPIYNEERTLRQILAHVLARPEVGEVLAVDDGSRDSTPQILRDAASRDERVRVFTHDRNLGKGAALRLAIQELRMPFALVQDADLEYDPNDYPALLRPLLTGRADVVFGARQFGGQSAYSYWFVKGGQGLTWVFNVLNNCYISDLLTGYKLLRSDLWKRLNLQRNGFDIDPEIAAKVIKLGYRIHETPISYYARSRAEGKKVSVGDGFTTVGAIWRVHFGNSKRVFGQAVDDRYHRRRHEELALGHPLASPPSNYTAPEPAEIPEASEKTQLA